MSMDIKVSNKKMFLCYIPRDNIAEWLKFPTQNFSSFKKKTNNSFNLNQIQITKKILQI